ncbi:MAG TPA: dihydrodipicolinate synthase family protein [Planctomycetota bacterium]|nr:dihydrodipicolinate synthase family protein [Planctomycetota bacterium]
MRGFLDRIKPGRKIDANSAVLLPFTADGKPDYEPFAAHLLRTARAGITPAVNMDTGFGPQLTPAQRVEVLKLTRKTLGTAPFIAGACCFGETYEQAVAAILDQGGIPILFQSEAFAAGDVIALYQKILAPAPRALAFELGTMFAPFGRIYDLDTYKRLMDLPNVVGAKHSSLSRALEIQRLDLRDQHRPDFKVYTGNDLAIDMVMYGSDYLLGISTFDPDAFALRDQWWAQSDDRFFELNDALQALGAVAFRDPVPAYKDSAAAYLKVTGKMKNPLPHPACPRRPANEPELLAPLARQIAIAAAR